MSDSTASLRRKIASAGDLQSVVRTMKALAASSVGQYERSVQALADYYRAVELGLGACFRASVPVAGGAIPRPTVTTGAIGAIVFGSDQGLVGRFNERVADHALETLAAIPGEARLWAVGERVHARLTDAGLLLLDRFAVPSTVKGITPLVGELLLQSETRHSQGELGEIHLFYNRRQPGAVYGPVSQRLLPLDEGWRSQLAEQPWPTTKLAEVLGSGTTTLSALIREYLFISLFRACAESLASENTSRLAAMERAERNIDELLETLRSSFNRLRQSSIDEELFDVIAGFEALTPPEQR